MTKYTKFKSNGYAPSYTPKRGQTTFGQKLQGIKQAVKVEKKVNEIKPKKGKK